MPVHGNIVIVLEMKLVGRADPVRHFLGACRGVPLKAAGSWSALTVQIRRNSTPLDSWHPTWTTRPPLVTCGLFLKVFSYFHIFTTSGSPKSFIFSYQIGNLGVSVYPPLHHKSATYVSIVGPGIEFQKFKHCNSFIFG